MRLNSLSIRHPRPSVFTEDEFNQSDDDRRSFYSEIRNKLNYNFEERNELYEDEPAKTKGKSGFAVSPSKHMAETVGFVRPARMSLQLSEQMNIKKEF